MAERWRVGTSPGTYGRTIYRHVDGGPERGELIGLMDTPELAAKAVEAVNDRDKLDRIRVALGAPQGASLPEVARTYRELAETQAAELHRLRLQKSLGKEFGDRFGRYLRLLDIGLPGDRAWEESAAESDRG